MRRHSLWIVPLLLAIIVPQGQAGIFKRPNKPDPVEHVPALINTLKTDPDDKKRANAAEELHEYDSRSFPDIMPALTEALHNDRSSSVRLECVRKLRSERFARSLNRAFMRFTQAAKNDPDPGQCELKKPRTLSSSGRRDCGGHFRSDAGKAGKPNGRAAACRPSVAHATRRQHDSDATIGRACREGYGTASGSAAHAGPCLNQASSAVAVASHQEQQTEAPGRRARPQSADVGPECHGGWSQFS